MNAYGPPRWALWDFEAEKWDVVPPENAPGEWLGGHEYGLARRVPVDFNNIEDDGRLLLGPRQRLVGVDGDEEVEIVAVSPDWHTQRPSVEPRS